MAPKNKRSKVNLINKPRGKMSAYAFFVQTCSEEHKRKHPEEKVVVTEFFRKWADRWKTLSDYGKKRFFMMAECDKKRFDCEMATFNAVSNQTSADGKKSRKRTAVKDPNAPKKNCSAFFFFCKDKRSEVKEANPDFAVGDITKEIGKQWADIDPKVKSKYEKQAEDDKIRYEKEKTEYDEQKKNGVGDTAESDSE
eukprot:GFUD01013768.1.p1 GENE.GFUD01013768.1~~GFUD01013768.1.p1  ORF type:complete len:196 (+),score=61.11 GFUD01013768.1:31-618(+)